MTLSNFIQLIIVFLLVYMALYALVNRVCACIEAQAWAKAFKSYLEKTTDGNTPDIAEFTEALKNVGKKNDKEV